MRVLHLPTDVGGGPPGLSEQLNKLGVRSEVWTIDQNYLNYPVDRVLTDPQQPIAVQMLKVLRAGSYVFGPWDVVNFNYGSTLFSNGGKLLSMRGAGWRRGRMGRLVTAALNGASGALQRAELAVLRARRIPVFVYYQGDDVRQGDYSREHYEFSIATRVPPEYYTSQSDRWKRKQAALMSKHAAGVYAVNPDLLNVLPSKASFVPYGHVPVRDWTPRYTQGDRDRVVFAHAPSNRRVKGIDLILDALAELQSEGYRFDLDLVEGVSNAEALARYEDADVVIDQLFAGWYGGVAVEAMALGKPVVVYIRDSDLGFLPPGMADDLPFFRATPATIKEDLRRILELPREELLTRARASRAFAEKWHDPVEIASRVAADYRREVARAGRKGGPR